MTYSEHELEFTFAKNRLIFGKVKAYREWCQFLDHPVHNYRLRDSPEVTTSNKATDAEREATSINRKINCVCIIFHCQLAFDASTETKMLNIVNKPAINM